MTTSTSDAASRFSGRQQSPLQRLQGLLHSYPWVSPLVILIVSFIVFTILNPDRKSVV